MAADYLNRLAAFVVDTRLEDMNPSTVHAAKDVVLDTIGAMLAGSMLEENVNLARLVSRPSEDGKSTLIGHSGKAQPMMAALSNATAGVALEVDEGSRLGGGHPGIHVAPAAFAIGEEKGSTGKQVLESIIAGYEVTSRIGGATRSRHEIHSHGTWGTLGSAAASALLMGFDADGVRSSINLAASMSPANTWTPCFEGATIRNLYPGRSNFQGILAANLSQCGFTGINDGPTDIYSSVLGEGFDAEQAVAGLGHLGEYRIQQNYFKMHACCWYNHPVLDAVEDLLGREKFQASEVVTIKVEAPPMAATMANPHPANMLSAKFSIPYAVAAAIVHGTTGVDAFYPQMVEHPQIPSLAEKVDVQTDGNMDLRRYDYPTAKVTVTLSDGRNLRQEVAAHRGDSRNPVHHEELQGKFLSLAREALGEECATQVIEMAGNLENLDNIRQLTGLLVKV